jgi:hypothetical protein
MIQRYDLWTEPTYDGEDIALAEMRKFDNGEWVKWEDVKEVIRAKIDVAALKSSNVDLLIINPELPMRPHPLQYFVELARKTLDAWGLNHIKVMVGDGEIKLSTHKSN